MSHKKIGLISLECRIEILAEDINLGVSVLLVDMELNGITKEKIVIKNFQELSSKVF